MKIAPRAAEAFLGSPAREHVALLLYGPDSGLVRERAKAAIKSLLGDTYDPFALTEFTEAKILSDPALLSDELSAISMMSPKRVVLVRDAGDKLTKIIDGAADQLRADAYLIVCGDELSARSSLRAWFEKAPNAASVACYNDEARDVHEVIRKRFAGAGIQCDRDAMEYLASQLGNDRGVTLSELEKLITYAGAEKRLTLSDVESLVDYNRETNLDDIVNAAADRNLKGLEVMIGRVLREGLQPIVYLRAMQRYFNRLYFIRGQMSTGQSADMVIQSLRPPVFFRQLPILTRHVQQWEPDAITRALKLLVEAELACKTSDLPPIPASSRKLFQLTQAR